MQEWSQQWQIPDYNSPVVLSSEYHSVEDFCNRIHCTLSKSFKTCASIATTWDTVPAGIPCRLGYRAGGDTVPAGIPCHQLGIPCHAGYRAGCDTVPSTGGDTVPAGIPCRRGYRAGGDTVPAGIPCRLAYWAINWRGYRAAQRCGTQRAPFCLLCARRRCTRTRGRVTELVRVNRRHVPCRQSTMWPLLDVARGSGYASSWTRAKGVHVASGSHSP